MVRPPQILGAVYASVYLYRQMGRLPLLRAGVYPGCYTVRRWCTAASTSQRHIPGRVHLTCYTSEVDVF